MMTHDERQELHETKRYLAKALDHIDEQDKRIDELEGLLRQTENYMMCLISCQCSPKPGCQCGKDELDERIQAALQPGGEDHAGRT